MNATLTLFDPKKPAGVAVPVSLNMDEGQLVMNSHHLQANLNLTPRQMTELASLLERQVWQHQRTDAQHRQGQKP